MPPTPPTPSKPFSEPGDAHWERRLAAWSAPAPAAPVAAPPARATFTYRLRWPLGPDGRPELQIQVSHASSPAFHALSWHLYKVGRDDAEADVLVEPAIYRIRKSRPVFRDGETRSAAAWLVVPAESLEDLLPRLGLHPRVETDKRRPLAIHPTIALRPGLALREDAEGPLLAPIVTGPGGPVRRDEATLLGPAGARWAAWRGEIFRVDPAAEAAWDDDRPIRVPPDEREAFEHRWLPTLAAAGTLVDERHAPLGAWPQGTPRPQLVLEEEADFLVIRVGFVYGDARVEAPGEEREAGESDGRATAAARPGQGPGRRRKPAPSGTPNTRETRETGEAQEAAAGLVGPPGGPLVRRDAAAEAAWLASLGQVLRGRVLFADAALDFLEETCPALVAAGWEIVGRNELKAHRLAPERPIGRINLSTGTDWFDVHSELILGAEAVRWPALKKAIETGARYVRLDRGDWARLPLAWLESQRRLRERLAAYADEPTDARGALRLARHQAPLIADVLEGTDDDSAAIVDAGWRAFREGLARAGACEDAPVPAGFAGTLRPYQRQGLSYLSFLRDHGLHGILADDMGLGKTVQTAALLAANHPNDVGPSLIVAPTSLLANWQSELARFAPGLRVRVLHGPDRVLDPETLGAYDVLITTYATARLDLAAHRARTYHTVILDEAQAIKNPRSQTARAMRRLNARHRLALTGTPVENDATDLWSLFAFLMPGMLGRDEGFRARYATPIAQGDMKARAELRARVAPFILRRLKSQVAPELPPRVDVVLTCELAPAQRRAYDMLLTGARERIQRSIESQGLDRSRVTILDALLKLRQVCCHPALLGTPETMHMASAKLDAALALIEELIAGGHRALVFSQFTSMLAILREQLDARGVAYEYLDGATRDRQARVDRFNAGATPLFLISLKAGGTGLNLTGADYVVHYDPWWNPAAEDQATDRAHRIGQTRQVFNYKLVARDTIEEKLLALQAEKRALVRDLLATDATGKRLTAADVAALFG